MIYWKPPVENATPDTGITPPDRRKTFLWPRGITRLIQNANRAVCGGMQTFFSLAMQICRPRVSRCVTVSQQKALPVSWSGWWMVVGGRLCRSSVQHCFGGRIVDLVLLWWNVSEIPKWYFLGCCSGEKFVALISLKSSSVVMTHWTPFTFDVTCFFSFSNHKFNKLEKMVLKKNRFNVHS